MDRFEPRLLRQAPPQAQALDFLGRMPVPLRRPFKSLLDGWVNQHREATGSRLASCFLKGCEYYRPFDALGQTKSVADLPALTVSPASLDLLSSPAFDLFAQANVPDLPKLAPACIEAGLADPERRFFPFALIPFVFLVDHEKLGGRALPRRWSDLLAPELHDEIVMGGWRPNDSGPYRDYNAFLLGCLLGEFGASGIARFAANVLKLQHNIVTARHMGSDSPFCGAIAILPWMQAELCPNRARTTIVWPEDGALTMPIGLMLRPGATERAAPLLAGLASEELARLLDRNGYPSAWAGHRGLPAGARLKWPGWDAIRTAACRGAGEEAAKIFFAAWWAKQGERLCA